MNGCQSTTKTCNNLIYTSYRLLSTQMLQRLLKLTPFKKAVRQYSVDDAALLSTGQINLSILGAVDD